MTDEFAPEKKARKPRQPYVRTGLDDELTVTKKVNNLLRNKLATKESRQRVLTMVGQYIEAAG